MPSTTLTRRVTFAAAHRYRRPEWSDARNEEVFGLCARPSYHGHTYVCDVTVRGEIDEVTGMIVDLAVLDRVLADEVSARFDHRNINLEVPDFADGKQVPTGENLARFIFHRVQRGLGDRVTVTAVRVAEDNTLAATHQLDSMRLAGLLWLLLFQACAKDEEPLERRLAALPPTPAELQDGERLYTSSCASCHGPKAGGTMQGPPLAHDFYAPGHHADISFEFAVQRGVPAHHWRFGDMPAQPSVSRETVARITAYVRWVQRGVGIK